MAQLLKDTVVVVTKDKGPKCPAREVVHFSSEYKPEEGNDLEAMFPGTLYTYTYCIAHQPGRCCSLLCNMYMSHGKFPVFLQM